MAQAELSRQSEQQSLQYLATLKAEYLAMRFDTSRDLVKFERSEDQQFVPAEREVARMWNSNIIAYSKGDGNPKALRVQYCPNCDENGKASS